MNELESTSHLASLSACEETISRNLDYFLEAGRALMVIRENFTAWGLKAEHGTFETYCRAKWSMSRPRAYQMIEAAEVMDALSTTVDKPANERHARALAAAPPEKRAEVWKEAVETAPQGKVTAKHIKEVVNRATGEVMDPDDLEIVKESREQTATRGSFDDAAAMMEGFRQIMETLKGMTQLKPKASMVGAVVESARDVVSCANKLIASIERAI